MTARLLIFTIAICLLSLPACNVALKPEPGVQQSVMQPRMAAEWEPAIGVIITWPLGIPHKLVIELAKENRLYTMVSNETEKKDAGTWFKKWGIDLNNVQFIMIPLGVDAWWTRDWGPHAVFTEPDGMKLADGKYENSTPISSLDCNSPLHFLFTEKNDKGETVIIPTVNDDLAPYAIGKATGFDVIQLPFVFTGGNVITDGHGSVFSTCVITNENRYIGMPDSDFFQSAQDLLGLNRYHLISNFEENGIQHIDCYLKLIDEERLFVMRPPKGHKDFKVYEDIVTHELTGLKNAYGRPYQILRLDTDVYRGDELAAYSNSLILNTTVYVPLFGIDQDAQAMQQWQEALPGYTIKGFPFVLADEPVLDKEVYRHYQDIGWNNGDALHCRTRAMWDPEMLFISVDRLPETVKQDKEYGVFSKIIDYSKKGLINQSQMLHWRANGGEWHSEVLDQIDEDNTWVAFITSVDEGDFIEYYVSAKSTSGREEFMPRSAPKGLYRFSIEK